MSPKGGKVDSLHEFFRVAFRETYHEVTDALVATAEYAPAPCLVGRGLECIELIDGMQGMRMMFSVGEISAAS
jgi:hypothetical protein